MEKELWDKTFEEDPAVKYHKVHFTNRFGIELVGDLYEPAEGNAISAIAVCGPFGAVKEQASGLYAQTLAKQGFMALAFDPSFTGESGGEVRYMNSPDINTEDFMAAVDYLLVNENIPHVGILGICGWGGMALNAAACDPRIEATVTSTMYDMSRVTEKGYFDAEDSKEARAEKKKAMAEQRTADAKAGTHALGGGVVDPLPEDAPYFVKDYHAYYKTPRGYHPRSLNSNDGWTVITPISLMNQPINTFVEEIDSPVMLVHGDKAHSYYFSKDLFERLQGDNKEMVTIPGASHTDLYDQVDIIPFEKIGAFFKEHLEGIE